MRMAKRKTTNNSREDLGALALPQTRLLRSRKRKCPCDETDDVQASLHQQGNDGKNTPVSSTVTVVVTPLPSPQSSPLQKCAMMIEQQNGAAQQSCLTNPHGSSSEKQTEATNEAENIHSTNMAVTEEEKATVTNLINDSQLEHLNKHSDDDTNMIEKNKEAKAAEECKRSPDLTNTDQIHVLMLVSEDSDGFSATALKKNLEENQKNSQEDSSTICITDAKQNTKESAAGLPAKKKQRMGVCGLTEKERRQILLIQNRENGEKGMKRGEICNDTAKPVIMSPSLSIPANTEQSEAELQSGHCVETDRKNEVHATVTVSDGNRTVCEGKGDAAPDLEQIGNPESDIPAEKAGVEGLGNQLLEFKGPMVKIMADKLEIQRVEDGSAEVNCNSATTFHASQKKEEVNQESTEATQLQEITVPRARDEKEEEVTGDAVGGDRAGECASSSVNQSGGLNCGSVEVCEATVTPSFSEKKHSCETDAEPTAGSSTVSTDDTQTRDTADLFGSGSLDYVSDSQLNTIVLIEEVVMEKEEKNDSTDCCEDATDLIRGLIRELSSLNRRVMAAHRELDSLRRSSKGSRSSIR